MPHYDYKCTECGYKFEMFQKMNEDHVSICPSCGGKVKRLIGKGAGPIFKGSGFYQTDYKNTNKDQSKKESIKPPEGKPASPDDKPKKDIKQGD